MLTKSWPDKWLWSDTDLFYLDHFSLSASLRGTIVIRGKWWQFLSFWLVATYPDPGLWLAESPRCETRQSRQNRPLIAIFLLSSTPLCFSVQTLPRVSEPQSVLTPQSDSVDWLRGRLHLIFTPICNLVKSQLPVAVRDNIIIIYLSSTVSSYSSSDLDSGVEHKREDTKHELNSRKLRLLYSWYVSQGAKSCNTWRMAEISKSLNFTLPTNFGRTNDRKTTDH